MCQLKRDIFECKWMPVFCTSYKIYCPCIVSTSTRMNDLITCHLLPLEWQRRVTVDSIQVKINLLRIWVGLCVRINTVLCTSPLWLTSHLDECDSYNDSVRFLRQDVQGHYLCINCKYWISNGKGDILYYRYLISSMVTRNICKVDWSETRRALCWRTMEFKTGYLSSYSRHHQLISSF